MQNILVPVDFSDVTKRVIEKAAELACGSGCKMFLLHVAPPHPEFAGRQLTRRVIEDEVPEDLKQVHHDLHEMAAELRRQGREVDVTLVQGNAVDEILHEADRVAATLIALGSHGHGALYRAVVGSVSEGVLRDATCPLLIVPSLKEG